MRIRKPTLILDKEKAKANIRRMVEKAQRNGCELRPHFKTHQSHEVGSWYREQGIQKATVSSVSMARYFSEDGWTDLTIAFPANLAEIDEINSLASTVWLNLLVESSHSIESLSDQLENDIGLFIKIDLGTHRTGVDPQNLELLKSLIHKIQESPNVKFQGFLGHSGHSYAARSEQEILLVHEHPARS